MQNATLINTPLICLLLVLLLGIFYPAHCSVVFFDVDVTFSLILQTWFRSTRKHSNCSTKMAMVTLKRRVRTENSNTFCIYIPFFAFCEQCSVPPEIKKQKTVPILNSHTFFIYISTVQTTSRTCGSPHRIRTKSFPRRHY